MDGDIAPLSQLVKVCQAHEAALLVDEAHATGVLGPQGAGLTAALGLESQVDLRMGTLSKSLGCVGAYVTGSQPVLSLLVHRARSLVFSTSLPPALCWAAKAAVELCALDDARRARLWANIRFFAEGLRALGFDAHPRSAIFPVVVGTPEAAVEASRKLRAGGVLAKPIRPPTVPPGTSRLRFAVTAAHRKEHLERALSLLADLEISPHAHVHA
jgi:8-amino-7-oxononanoate synthase